MLPCELAASATEVAGVDFFDVTVDDPDYGRVEEPEWKGKGRETLEPSDSAIALPDLSDEDAGGDDWTKYEPPAVLKTAPGVDSEIILQIIQDSIERVKTRITEDEERPRTEAEATRANEEEVSGQEGGTSKRPEIPSVSAGTLTAPVRRPPSPPRNPHAHAMSRKTLRIGPHGLPVPASAEPKSKKRSLFTLLKSLNHSGENGETSAAGASRHKHSGSLSSLDPIGRKWSALDAIRKAAASGGSSRKPSPDADAIV